MKKIILITTCLLSIVAFAQTKKISLDDAVLQQNRLFRADRMAGFQWVPNTNKYTYYIENGIKLMQANATETTPKLLLELKDLNKKSRIIINASSDINFKAYIAKNIN